MGNDRLGKRVYLSYEEGSRWCDRPKVRRWRDKVRKYVEMEGDSITWKEDAFLSGVRGNMEEVFPSWPSRITR